MLSYNEIAALVVKAQAGDKAAQNDLIVAFQPTVFAIAIKQVKNVADAEDITQDVLCKFLTNLGSVRDAQAFVCWVRQITENAAKNFSCRARLLTNAEDCTFDAIPDREEAEVVDFKSAVAPAIEKLSPILRDTINAHYVEGKKIRQIAQESGELVATIKGRLRYGRDRLRELLGV